MTNQEMATCNMIPVYNMQFGFMPSRGKTDAIFIVQQIQEKYNAKRKLLYFSFVDLKKAFDRVLRKIFGGRCYVMSIYKSMTVTAIALVSKLGDGGYCVFLYYLCFFCLYFRLKHSIYLRYK